MSKNKRPKIRGVRIFDLFVSTISENGDIYETLGLEINPTREEQDRVYNLIKEGKVFINKIALQDTIRLKELFVRASRKNRNEDKDEGIKVVNKILYPITVCRTESEEEELRDLIEKEKSRARNPTEDDESKAYQSIKNGDFASELVGDRAIYVETVLHDAIRNFNTTEIIDYVKNKVADINAVNSSGETALHIAARTNQTEIIKLLPENGANINTKVLLSDIYGSYLSQTGRDINANTPHNYNKFAAPYRFSNNVLHLAAQYNCIDSAKILIEKGADINAKNNVDRENTPLHSAAAKGHIEIAKILIENGANLHAKNLDEKTPLDIAKKEYNDAYLDILTRYQNLNNNLLRIYRYDLGKVEEIAKQQGNATNISIFTKYQKLIDLIGIYHDNSSINSDKKLAEIDNLVKEIGNEEVGNLVKEIVQQQDNDANIDISKKHQKLSEKLLKIHNLLKIYTNDLDTVREIDRSVKEIAEQQDAATNIDIFTKYQKLNEKLLKIYKNDSEKVTEINNLVKEIAKQQNNAASIDIFTKYEELSKKLAAIYNENKDSGNIDQIKTLAESAFGTSGVPLKVLINMPIDAYDNTILHEASGTNRITIVKELIENGASIDAINGSGNTPLHLAAVIGSETMVKELIAKGASIDAKNIVGNTPLHLAAIANRITIVKELIEKGASIDATNDSGNTPLHEAAIANRITIVRELILKDAKIDATNDSGNTPLHLAIIEGNETIIIELIGLLIANRSNIDAQNDSGNTPLHEAAIANRITIVRDLIEIKANIEAKNNSGNTPLHEAARMGNETIVSELIEKLIENGASIDAQNNSGGTPLHEAARIGNETIVSELIENGASIDAQNNSGDTPLHEAARIGNETIAGELISLFIVNNLNLDTKNILGNTPLHEALIANRIKIVRDLIRIDVDIDTQNVSGDTPLHEAVRIGNETIVMELIEKLIEKGASIDTKDKSKNTPLHEAARLNKITIVRKLIAEGANVNSIDSDNRTPLHKAARLKNIKIFKELVANGADINAKDNSGETPLHEAVRFNRKKIVRLLIANSADINAKNKSENTPLHEATRYNRITIVRKLIAAKGADIDAQNHSGNTPLHEAAGLNGITIVKMLIANGAKIDAKNNYELTALEVAQREGDNTTVYILKKYQKLNQELAAIYNKNKDSDNIDQIKDLAETALGEESGIPLKMLINMPIDAKGNTILHLALRDGNVKIAKLLINEGADVKKYSFDADGRKTTSIQLALDYGCKELVPQLITKGAIVNDTDSDKRTPLHTAAKAGDIEAIKLLAYYDAKIDAEDKFGKTAYDTAKDNNQEEVKKLLAYFGANTPILDRISTYLTPKKSPYKTSTESRNIDLDHLNLEGEAKKPTPPQSLRDRRMSKKSPSKPTPSLSISTHKALTAIDELDNFNLGETHAATTHQERFSVISPRQPSSAPPLDTQTSKNIGLTILGALSPSDSPSNSPKSSNVIGLASRGINDDYIKKIIDDYTSKEENIADQKNDENRENRETIIKAFEKSLEGQKTKQIPDKAYRGIGAASHLVDIWISDGDNSVSEVAPSGKQEQDQNIKAIKIDEIFASDLGRFYPVTVNEEKKLITGPDSIANQSSLKGQYITEVLVGLRWQKIAEIIGEGSDLSKLATIFHDKGNIAFKTVDKSGQEQSLCCKRGPQTVFVAASCKEAVAKDSELGSGTKFSAKTHGLECLDGFNNDKEINTLKMKSATSSRG